MFQNKSCKLLQMNLADCTDNTWASCFQVLFTYPPLFWITLSKVSMNICQILKCRRLLKRSWTSRQMSLVVFNRMLRRITTKCLPSKIMQFHKTFWSMGMDGLWAIAHGTGWYREHCSIPLYTGLASRPTASACV